MCNGGSVQLRYAIYQVSSTLLCLVLGTKVGFLILASTIIGRLIDIYFIGVLARRLALATHSYSFNIFSLVRILGIVVGFMVIKWFFLIISSCN